MTPVPRCPACGAFIQGDDRFCWGCGSQLVAAAPSSANHARPDPRFAQLGPEAALTLRRAHLAQQRGQLQEAEQLVRSILEGDPEAVPALSMLVALLRARGDLVQSVAIAQRISELVGQERGPAPPGAVARAREDRARIEEQVVREVVAPLVRYDTPLTLLTAPERAGARSKGVYALLSAIGLACLFLSLVAVLRGQLAGYLWFAASLLAAGWCYQDAESRGMSGVMWASFALCLGPFGLAIYLLSTRWGSLT